MTENLLNKTFWKQSAKPFQLITIGLIIIYVLLLIKTAWLSDDAYITFRTIDNFVNGFGLRWNIVERVQSFTHPLWLFLLSSIYYFTREIFFSALFTSILISLIAVYILSFKIARSYKNAILILLSIVFSKAFIDYSTSGLENPLTNLLFVLFGYVYFKEGQIKNTIFLLSLISSLILINRMDCFLLVLPAIIYYNFKNKSYRYYFVILLGILPFILWELFSLLYYGSLFPNTAYAKLNTGIDRLDLIYQGLKYFISSIKLDPLTLSLIFLGIFISVIKSNRKYLPLTLGVLIYLLYIIWVGGDFMNGRFFVAPLVIILMVMGNLKLNSDKLFLLSIVSVLIIGLSGPSPTVFGDKFPRVGLLINEDGICDERVFYTPTSSLLFAVKGAKMPFGKTVLKGRIVNQAHSKFETVNNIGFFGYYAGSQCFILDDFALSDPLLSHLPAKKNSRIGHFQRKIPIGYEQSLITNQNKIRNASLSKYYDKILLITRGNLWSVNRLKEIWKINTGQYNYLLNNYLKSLNSGN